MIDIGIVIGVAGILATVWAGLAAWKSLRLTQERNYEKGGGAFSHKVTTKRPALPDTYLKVASSIKGLMSDSEGDFPGSMTKNLASKVLLAAECANILKDYSEERNKVYFAMSTTCHIIFEIALQEKILSDYLLEVHTSSLPLLLSAQINRVNCNVFGRRLVHEYASLTFDDNDEPQGVDFDCAFFGVRGIVISNQEIVIRSCKQEHCGILRDALSRTKKAAVVVFDSSKLVCADGSNFIRVSSAGLDFTRKHRRAKLYLVTDVPPATDLITSSKFNELDRMLQVFGFSRRNKVDCVMWVS